MATVIVNTYVVNSFALSLMVTVAESWNEPGAEASTG